MAASETALLASVDQELRVACYCEENVWRLAYRKTQQQTLQNKYIVVFISNATKSVPMFFQTAASAADKPCCWDYHVILVSVAHNEDSQQVLVWDLDSRLPYPCPLADYLEQSFPFAYADCYMPFFRLIPAMLYLDNFSSDRMHMYDAVSGKWNAPPPVYPSIGSSRPSNLYRYLDFNATNSSNKRKDPIAADSNKFGTILSLFELYTYEFAFND